MTDKSQTTVETIHLRLRVCVYKDHLGGYSYMLDDYSEMSADTHIVWIEADVPVRPVSIKAEVKA